MAEMQDAAQRMAQVATQSAEQSESQSAQASNDPSNNPSNNPSKKVALLIFTKPPLEGLVKTRMTVDYGGFLDMKQAAVFYKCCFYDVCEMGMHALIELQRENDEAIASDPATPKITYDFFVSTTPAEQLDDVKHLFEEIGPWPMEVHFLVDEGSTFDEHFNDAFRQLFELGYESIVSIGGDVPTMPKAHLKQGFQWLEYFQSIGKPGFVVAPCQECGTSLVGYSFNTPIDHDGVYYNLDGRPALDGYMEKLRGADIPSAYFEPVADVDEVTDLAHAISCMKAIREAAPYQGLFVPHRTLSWVESMGIVISTPPNDNHDPRDYLDGETDSAPAAGGETGTAGAGEREAGGAGAGAGVDVPADAAATLSIEEMQRIAKGMTAIQDERRKTNAYESAQYH